jgi:glutamine amidotransferase
MCRMVGYLGGPPVSLSSVVLEPEHSLHVQSYAPTEMASGVVNADGFGWYAPGDEEVGASLLQRRGDVSWR